MENNQIRLLTDSFEGNAQQTENGVKYWLARDLQSLLGYTEFLGSATALEISNGFELPESESLI